MMDDRTFRRFMKSFRVDPTEGCWIWIRSSHNHGYAKIMINRKVYAAHRVSYEHFVAPILDGNVIDHLCRNTGCVNPRHLDAVSHKENVKRGDAGNWQKIKTHCPQGHIYDEENTGRNQSGSRFCKACRKEKLARKAAQYRERAYMKRLAMDFDIALQRAGIKLPSSE